MEILPKIAKTWDEPFADNSVIPTILVSQLAREHVTVSLSADGGDELFGGYGKYQQASKLHHLFSNIPMKKGLASILKKIQPESMLIDNLYPNFSHKYRRVTSSMSSNSATQVMQNLQQVFSDAELQDLLSTNYTEAKTNFNKEKELNESLSDLDRMMAIDFKTYQLDDILTKVDRATMSVSLEGREPLLDHRLIEYVARLDSTFKIKDGNKKHILKEITHKYLPKEIMDRPKMGFSVPIIDWFSGELNEYLDYYFEPKRLTHHGLFNSRIVMRMKEQYLAGHKYYIGKLWTVLVFQMWYERWMK